MEAPSASTGITDFRPVKPVFAPLPDVPAHVIQPGVICHKTSHWACPRITVVVPFDHWPVGGFLSNLRFLSGIVPCSLRRRPLLAPRIKLDLAILLLRISSFLTLQPYADTPLRIGRQSIDSSVG